VRIAASLHNSGRDHRVTVTTGEVSQDLPVRAKDVGQGSSVNGGEFLMLALASCCCNDIYREAARLGLIVDAVDVEAEADFEGAGLAARNIRYRVRVASSATRAQVAELLKQTDAVAEVHNTVRAGAAVSLVPWESV
jgi:organic hydroperoxide reductase OsmC/OhrA